MSPDDRAWERDTSNSQNKGFHSHKSNYGAELLWPGGCNEQREVNEKGKFKLRGKYSLYASQMYSTAEKFPKGI